VTTQQVQIGALPLYRDVEAPSPETRYFYVSCIDHDRRALVVGPYSTHAAALADVARVRAEAERVDPRAFWYAWGTAGSVDDLGPGVLGRPQEEVSMKKTKYRYKCRSCKQHGRWRLNPNDAGADGERHYDRHSNDHECNIENQEGKDVGPCH
jgi:hypothetical protein